ncbi:MAG: type II secretion system F family protein [Sedimentisphaerales bacterium]|nr:type II secretion system F family protein [Sedimentisphaerales bacterium]
MQNEVLNWLRQQNLIPVEVRQVQESSHRILKTRGLKVKSADLAAFCWQLTTMVEGGVTTANALDTIAHDTDNQRFGHIIKEISNRMKRGESFSSSVSEYPRTFSNLFSAMILISETGGSLPTVLHRLGTYYDERDKLIRKIKSAMSYPVFAIIIITMILVVIMAVVVPMFKEMFAELGGDLPGITKGFIAFYDFLLSNFSFIVGAIIFMVIGVFAFSKTALGRITLSRLFLSIPLFGKLITHAFVAMFCRTAATLLGAGVSIVDSLDILSDTTRNTIIKSAIRRGRESVIEGSSVSAGLASSGFFPHMVITMITVGEESGSLPEILDRTSEYYDRKVESTLATVMALVEPAMIVTVGLIVLVIVLALYMPIFTRGGNLGA